MEPESAKANFHRELCAWLDGHDLGRDALCPFWSGSLKHPFDLKNPELQSGHPLVAELVVVGFNPSSGVDEYWFDFWDPETGFNLQKFQDCRTAKCKRDGKGRPISKTRGKIYQLTVETIGSNTVVVNTNIYWTVSPIAKTLKKQHRVVAQIEWLLEKIPNAIVVIHGAPARKHYEKLQASHGKLPDAIRAPHLSRISKDRFIELVKDVWQQRKVRSTLV